MIFNNRVGALLLLLVTAACGSIEQQQRDYLASAQLREQVAEQQARERIANLERQTRIAQAERQRLRELGCETGEQRQSGSVAIARGGSIDSTRLSLCGTPQVMQYLDSLVRQSVQPPHAPYGGGHRIPYSHYDTGSRPPGWYWGGGGHRVHPVPGYAPNGYPPVWNSYTRSWDCRDFYGNRYECLR